MTRVWNVRIGGGVLALAACVAPAAAQTGVVPALAADGPADITLASCGACADCGMTACECGGEVGCSDCAGGCDLGLGGAGALGRGQFFVGGEWLNLRGSFSEATAYRQIDETVEPTQETLEQFDFNYGSSYRVYAGYRLCECGGEVRFTYSNYTTDGDFNTGPIADPASSDVSIEGPYELVLSGPGDSISGRAEIDVDTYDIAFAKTIPLGGPLTCDPCGCGPCCPAWDLQWIGGIRVANVDSSLEYASNVVNPGANAPSRSAVSRVNFDGVGLRAGLLGRRYFGKSGAVSVYARGDISALLGEVDYSIGLGPAGGVFVPARITTTQVIPVTELEAGVTAWLTSNLSVTTGYMLSAWHDLGHRGEYDFSATGTQLQSMDDANMMTFDGLFVRAEAAF